MNIKILIIDDDKQDIKIMRRQLSTHGFNNIHTAETGEDGIKMADEIDPDVTIIDTILPGLDGFEVCRKIKESKNTDTKTIIITGKIRAVDALEARSAGADDYTVKAYDFKPLLNAMENIIDE